MAKAIQKHKRSKKRTAKHFELAEIMEKYGNEEFGDCIIDEICALFNYPLTPEE